VRFHFSEFEEHNAKAWAWLFLRLYDELFYMAIPLASTRTGIIAIDAIAHSARQVT
jgi:hypothetical protein